ncbi:MAG: hypothetical protein QHG99_04785 [Methanomicrobiales archaeon]|nr:hypothetical protein [Methanomicrobiales archaeon]
MRLKWEIRLGILLVCISILIYTLKFLLLGDPLNTYLYVMNSAGFLPINVLFVTLIINQLLAVRARRERLEKLNMVIGTFFSEMGTDMLKLLSRQDRSVDEFRQALLVRSEWTKDDYARAASAMEKHRFEVEVDGMHLSLLKEILVKKGNFMLRLLENPVLLEHGPFTEALRAVFHLKEELERRESLEALPEMDLQHLRGDAARIYSLIGRQWLDYMQYLQRSYPYLFSLAVRTNPFDPSASAVIEGRQEPRSPSLKMTASGRSE